MSFPRVVPSGDSALIVEFDERIDEAVNARAIGVASRVRDAALTGVRDVVPTYRSVAVYFDPLRTNHRALVDLLQQTAAHVSEVPSGPDASSSTTPIEIPVCYGGEMGPDLPAVARFARCSEDEVVALHAGPTYRVFMLGFVPGFAYMGIVDRRIAAPRHVSPRARVPIGSVGIASVQTGVYPVETPGGWQLVGRTPFQLVDFTRREPFLFRAGDRVRFVPIGRGEYEERLRATPSTETQA